MKYKLVPILAAVILTSCGNKDVKYDASGVFEATEVMVSARATGDILRLEVEEGQEVEAQAAIGYIDTIQLSLQKQQLLASRKATNSKKLSEGQQLASLRQQIANAQKEKKRFQDLLAKNAATQKQVDDIQYQIEVLQKQAVALQEQVSTANASISSQSSSIDAQVAMIEDKIQQSVIYSPITGTVLTKYAEPGEYAAPGKALFKVANLKDMKLRAYLTADQINAVKLGQKVTVYADEGKADRKAYEGVISWISGKAEFTPKTIQTRDERANLVYAVKITIKNDGEVKSGMYGDVKFE